MGRKSVWKILALALGVAGAGGLGADTPPVAALAAIQPGLWVLRARDGAGPARTLCLGDARQLLQIQHPGAACRRFISDNSARQVEVAYQCGASGGGRTSLRVETPRLIQIDSQGIAYNEPFAVAFEGRRVGACPIPTATAMR